MSTGTLSTRTRRARVAALMLTAAPVAMAEVVAVSTGGFELTQSVDVPLPSAAAFERFVAIGDWWSDAHTYGGQARRLRIEARPGGCWCEALPGRRGGVEQMRVVHVDRPHVIRFAGRLGPLQELGAQGAMTVRFAADGVGTRVTPSYLVSGFRAAGVADLAPLVDAVLDEQLRRFATPGR